MAEIASDLIGLEIFEGFYWVQYRYEGDPPGYGGWVPAEIDVDGDIHGAGIDLDDAEVMVVAIGHEICPPHNASKASEKHPQRIGDPVTLAGRWELSKD